MIKKLTVIFLMVFTLFSATACGASVSLYTGSENGNTVYFLEARLPLSLYGNIQQSGAERHEIGQPPKWRLEDWLAEFSRYVMFTDGSMFEYEGYSIDSNEYVATFKRTVTPNSGGSGSNDDSEDDNVVIKDYFYFYAVEVTEENPFNGLRSEYDAAVPGQSGTLMQMIKNGIGYFDDEGYHERLPSLSAAFSETAKYLPETLKLNFYLDGSAKMNTTGNKKVINGKTYYLWERSFDASEDYITYRYFRANSLGWNVTALIIAGVTVLIILIVTRSKKEKPTLLDKFPYDPSKYEDIYSNLPAEKSDKNGGFKY